MRKLISLLLTLVLLCGALPVTASAESANSMKNFVLDGSYKDGTFKDVPSTAWYAKEAATVYELGLIRGSVGGYFSPGNNVSLAHAVTMAARLHSIYFTGKSDFVQGSPWYQVYVDYAVANGIIVKGEFTDYSVAATRAQIAHVFAKALPKSELKQINTVTALPDVDSSTPYYEDIFTLYRAGVFAGSDSEGTFFPYTPISRAQIAAIIARMALPELRKTLKIEAPTTSAIQPLSVVRNFGDVKAVGTVQPFSEHSLSWEALKSTDLSTSSALAYTLTFSDATKFGRLPAGYDPAALLEWGKDPGLNMDILHKYGFTGKGAVIAYVDQPFAKHEQYNGVDLHYTNNTSSQDSMHGPSVLSLLAGKDIGIAPAAEVHYYGHSAWLADQTTHAECLYQIIEKNKTMPADERITMVGFSDTIDSSEKNADALRDAVAACEKAGIMVWFCDENGSAAFLPMSDKNDCNNLVAARWGGGTPDLVYVPAGGRTTAATMNGAKYIYWADGGLSWTMPYTLGLYAIVSEIDPTLSQNDLRKMIVDTAYVNGSGMRIVNPVGFVAAALTGVGRVDEAQAMLAEVAARSQYLYAVMDTAAMSKEDLTAVGNYLATITDATVLVVDASTFSNAQDIYAAMKKDIKWRGGSVAGVQIFGTSSMVPAFEVTYRVQMSNAVDEGGTFLTDLFYGNFDNSPEKIGKDYNVLDHFAEGWKVELTPDWPVVRLPLSKGEFSAFFKKYKEFAQDTGLEQMDLVNFSNPIFASNDHTDDMGTFLNRMKNEFRLIDVPYRLYGNLDGSYPVRTSVKGGFTTNNLSAENASGSMELLINTHGQWNNIDQCIFENGKEVRKSFLNIDTINKVLDDNPYYLDAWTCLNGAGMSNNLTTTALKGQCVGMFSATTIISNNGVNCRADLSKMKQGNFYYFYYCYLKALHDGQSRSQAFFSAQQLYGKALMEDSANGIRLEGNYQFNLYNLLAYHNFGVIEPDMISLNAEGYIKQAGQSVPKPQQAQQQGTSGAPMATVDLVSDGNPVGKAKTISVSDTSELKTGTYKIHGCTAQTLDNGVLRFTLEYTAPAGMMISVFDPPNGDNFMLLGGSTDGNRSSLVFDLKPETLRKNDSVTILFFFDDNDRFFVSFPASRV